MIGNNEIELNIATMSAALEEYLNKRLVGVALKVTGIKYNSSPVKYNGSTYSSTFSVSVETVEPTP